MRKVGERDKKRNSFTDFRGERMETLERRKKKLRFCTTAAATVAAVAAAAEWQWRCAVVAWVVPLPHTLVWSKAVNASRIEKRPKTASCSTSSFRCSHRPRRLKVGPNY